jgi:hypothetical protein
MCLVNVESRRCANSIPGVRVSFTLLRSEVLTRVATLHESASNSRHKAEDDFPAS